MIDPHVHFRDGSQSNKETICHGLAVAKKCGVSAVFDMPNIAPPLTGEEQIQKRFKLADKAGSDVFYGLYMGLTDNRAQIAHACRTYESFPRVVGFKLFAGKSTGNMSVPDRNGQIRVFSALKDEGYRGVVAVHCEKETLFQTEKWDSKRPSSHGDVRPPEAEIESVRDILGIARETGFRGHVHICHVSCPGSLDVIDLYRNEENFHVSCGVTAHHLLLSSEMMKGPKGLLMKVNPPVRSEKIRVLMWRHFNAGRIDWIESDHAPHTLKDKMHPPYASGLPGLPILPALISIFRKEGHKEDFIREKTHNAVCRAFQLDLPYHPIHDILVTGEYEFDVYKFLYTGAIGLK